MAAAMKRTSKKASGNPRKMRKANTRPVRGPVKQSGHYGDVREIPTVVANIVRGSAAPVRSAVLTGKEIMGYIQITPSSSTGLLGKELINPLKMSCERLKKFVAIYGQYRFKRMELTVQGNLPTTVGGNLYLGYSRNPDLLVPTGPSAPTVISSMENSMSVSVWSTSTFRPAVMTNEWYNVDDDSLEIMKTTQGAIFVAQGGLYNISGTAEIPLYLSYTVECRGQQNFSSETSPVSLFPSCSYTVTEASGSTNRWIATRVATETVAFPDLTLSQPYMLSPSLEVPTTVGNATATIMSVHARDTNTIELAFYANLVDYNQGTPIRNVFDATVTLPRYTVELIDPGRVSLYSSFAGLPTAKVVQGFSGRSTLPVYNAPYNPFMGGAQVNSLFQ